MGELGRRCRMGGDDSPFFDGEASREGSEAEGMPVDTEEETDGDEEMEEAAM